MSNSSATPTPQPSRMPWPMVALGAFMVPGLGHAMVGEGRRGVVIGGTLLGLFAIGMLLGGIDVVDRRGDTLWFAGQAMIGPAAFVADIAHRHLDNRRQAQVAAFADEHRMGHDDALAEMIRRGEPLAYRGSVGRVNEVGTLYCAIAGVMNLLAMLDAVGRATRRETGLGIVESKSPKVGGTA